MKNKKLILALAFTTSIASLAAGVFASPAVAQKKENPRSPRVQQNETIRISSIEARVRHVATGEVFNYTIEPGVTIPLAVGDQVAIRLRGQGPNMDKAMDLKAAWVQNRGDWRLNVVKSADDFIEVKAVSSNQDDRGKTGNLSQIQYTLQGPYDGKPLLMKGYLTFDIGGGPSVVPGNPVDSGVGGSTARKVTSSLYYGVLGRAPSAPELDRHSSRLQTEGVSAVRAVAKEIADSYNAPRTDQMDNRRVVGNLYRTLLGRTASDQELWDQDPGFRNNVGALRLRGIGKVVDTIVQSEEFATYQGLENLRYETTRRGVRPRYR